MGRIGGGRHACPLYFFFSHPLIGPVGPHEWPLSLVPIGPVRTGIPAPSEPQNRTDVALIIRSQIERIAIPDRMPLLVDLRADIRPDGSQRFARRPRCLMDKVILDTFCWSTGPTWKCEESMIKPFRIAAALLIIAIVSVALSACGSGGANVAAPQDTEAPSAMAAETTTLAEPSEPAKPEANVIAAPSPADTPADSTVQAVPESPAETTAETGETASVEVASVQDSPTVEVNLPEAEAGESALLTLYADYGFSLKLDLGAEIQASGWTEPGPSVTQGIIAFTYGGVNANLVWGPPEDRTALTFLADTYNILRASQPTVTFESISDGDLLISDQEGVYGGFKAADDSGASIGGGLIGAWICGDSETAFRMTLTGEDATVVQLRFERLLENFACSSS